MTSDPTKCLSLKNKNKCNISFENSKELKVIDISDIEISKHSKIRNLLLVKGMPFNLFSVSQLVNYAMLDIEFHSSQCLIKHSELNTTMLMLGHVRDKEGTDE